MGRVSTWPCLLLVCLVLLGGCSEPQPPTLSLYRAVQVGDLDQIKRHMHHGTDLEQGDAEGRRPLHLAAAQGNVVIAELLLDQGAQIDARDQRGRTALEEALLTGKVVMVKALVRRKALFDPQALLFEVARTNVHYREVVEYLVQSGAKVNALDGAGQTALHIATSLDGRLVVKRLLDAGADVNLPTLDGRTPLAIAQQAGYQDIVQLLRHHGALE